MTMSEQSTIFGSALLRALVVVGVVAAAAYLAAPSSFGAELLPVATSLAAAAIALVTWRRISDDRSIMWLGIGLYAVLFAAATLVGALQVFGDGRPFPSSVDVLRVAGAVCLVVGVVAGTRSRRRDTDALGGFEAGTLAIAIMVGVWLLVAEPALSDGEVVVSHLVAAVSSPLVISVAAAASLRAVGQRGLSVPLVTLAVGALLVLVEGTRRCRR